MSTHTAQYIKNTSTTDLQHDLLQKQRIHTSLQTYIILMKMKHNINAVIRQKSRSCPWYVVPRPYPSYTRATFT